MNPAVGKVKHAIDQKEFVESWWTFTFADVSLQAHSFNNKKNFSYEQFN